MKLTEDSVNDMKEHLGKFGEQLASKLEQYKQAQHKLWKFELQGRNGCRAELKKARSSGDRDVIMEGYFQNDDLLYKEWINLRDQLNKTEIEYEAARIAHETYVEIVRFIQNV